MPAPFVRLLVGALAAVTLVAVAPTMPAGAVDTTFAEGDLMAFGPNTDPIAGLTVTVLEQPALSATTDGSGHWRIDGLPVGSTATFALDGGERPRIQTATFTVPTGGLERVTFQSPDHAMYAVLESIVAEEARADRCQVASTVTRRGYSLYGGAADGTHGEPGATVTIDPVPSGGATPIYFNGSRFDTIWPDRALTETTADGGVLFLNLPPGTYTLTAHKAGATIRPVTITCRAGVLVNASPPWGLQVESGGLDLDETVAFPTATTSTTTTTAGAPTTSSPTTGSTSTSAIGPSPATAAAAATPISGTADYTG